jgi:hypothetical protein
LSQLKKDIVARAEKRVNANLRVAKQPPRAKVRRQMAMA